MRNQQHIVMAGTTAPSHIYPSLGLIKELIRRGHRVSYIIGEPLTGLIEPAGADVVSHPSILPLDDVEWPDDPGEAMQLFLDEAVAVLPRAADAFDQDRPDLILYDIGGFTGPVLAHRYGVPAVQLSPTLVAWDGYEEDMAEVISAIESSESGSRYYAEFDSWLQRNGISAKAKEWLTHPAHILSLIPRPMQPNAERVPDNVQFVGPCLDPERMADGGWQPPTADRPVLLVSFGTAYNDQLAVYRDCIEAFRNTGWHVVIAVGQHIKRDQLGLVPENIEIHETVPQLAVLAEASAFITHAGMGGCTEALWFGVPTVAIPQAVDQFGNAAMLESLGVGRHVPADAVSAPALREAVDAVATSSDVEERLAAIQAGIRADGGTVGAADAVEKFLGPPGGSACG